jgi:hypothetical protein
MKRENKGVYKISYNNCKEHFGEPLGAGGRGYDCRAVLINLGKYVGEGRARGSLLMFHSGYSSAIPRLFLGTQLWLFLYRIPDKTRCSAGWGIISGGGLPGGPGPEPGIAQ